MVITQNTKLKANHQGTISIEADNVTLDCAGHSVIGPGDIVDWGIVVIDRDNVGIRNCRVSGFLHGLRLLGASNADVRGNVVTGQTINGVESTDGVNNSFRSNEAVGNGAHGIIIGASSGGSVHSNVLSGNARGGLTIFNSSSGISVAGNTASRSGWSGILVIGSTDNELRDNRADDNAQSGISVQGASDGTDANNNVLTGNIATGNGWFGIDLAYFSAVIMGNASSAAFENTLRGNAASRNAMSGIGVFGDSSVNVMHENRGRNNAHYDGLDASTDTKNVWSNNNFGTTSGI